MRDKLFNLLHDPNVEFFLVAGEHLKRLILVNEHPLIINLKREVKADLLADKAFVIAREDIFNFLMRNGKLNDEQHFLLSNGDIRVVGEPQIKIEKGTP